MSATTRTTIGIMAALVATLALGLAPASANVRFDDDVIPAYARIAAGPVTGGVEEVFHTAEWAAIPFYRPPACVPADFNLLDFFDIPRVFGCGPQTVQTSTIWRNGPGIDQAPIMAQSRGLGAVPVWFVSWPELEAAMADGELTIGELAGLPSLLVGTASFYTETLHPTQAAQVPLTVFVARGMLDDGRSFQAQATRSGGAGRLTHVRIAFG
jgi:hypothetical protein